MLVLTRRPNQSIMIGDDVVVTVLEVKGDQIRLGIDAPRHVQVFREEVIVVPQEANGSAALGAGTTPAPGRPTSPNDVAELGPRPVPQHPSLRSAGPRSAA